MTYFNRISMLVFLCIFVFVSGVQASLLKPEDNELIPEERVKFFDMLEKDSFSYFIDKADEKTYLVQDSSSYGSPCSIAAVGFALTAYCIADYRGWIDRKETLKRVKKILRFFLRKVEGHKGFFYHFVNMRTGKREWSSELSSIDTALFLAGALFAAEYLGSKEIESLAKKLYNRVDWKWMMNNSDFLSLGWTPESGFIRSYWDSYSEHMILYALAIGAEKNAIPASSWYRWNRPWGEYKGTSYIYCGTGSLFVYQYSHAWLDFRKIVDKGFSWWANSVKATKVSRQFAIDNADKFKGLGENSWGFTACVGPDGYKGYGSQVGYYPVYDGTVSPCAAAGSIPFMPKECYNALKHMYDTYGKKIYWKYGFKDAYNIDANWFSDESLAIDVGITVLMVENYRSALVWKYFMKRPFVKRWLDRIKKV